MNVEGFWVLGFQFEREENLDFSENAQNLKSVEK